MMRSCAWLEGGAISGNGVFEQLASMWRGSSSLRIPDSSDYNPRTRQLHEITIRTFYGFRVFDPEACRLLLKEIAGMVRSQLKPKLMLWLCVDALVREKIEVPSYTRLTKLILGAINRRK
jgi:Domain of unknown function (DUF4158)